MNAKLDNLGIILSVGCMVHCILFPIVLPILPAVGFIFKHEGYFHLFLAGIIIVVALFALIYGRTKHHMNMPLAVASFGLMIIILMGYFEILGIKSVAIIIFTVFGSLLVALAHYLNHKYLCVCKHHE